MRKRQWSMVKSRLSMLFIKLITFSCTLLMSCNLYAQQASTIISKDKIVLGEQISLQIKIEGLSPASIKQDFVFPDSINHLEILSDSVQTINTSTLLYTLTLTSFDSGYWQLPAFEMTLFDERKLVTEPLGITVMPVDVSTMVDYHDIKDILEVKPENNWWIIAAIVALALVSLFGFLWFHNNKSATQQAIVPVANLEKLYNTFLQHLSKLEGSDQKDRSSIVNIYKESSNAIRIFIDAAYFQNTAHLTTGEYMLKVKGKFPDIATENTYFQFLRLSDSVKFAKYIPPVEETRTIFTTLRNIASEVYQQNKVKN